MGELKVWTNHTDTIVASSWEEVVGILENHYGDVPEIKQRDEWMVVDADREISIRWNPNRNGFPTPHSKFKKMDPGNAPDWTHMISAPAFAWADHYGKGFLCSTQW